MGLIFCTSSLSIRIFFLVVTKWIPYLLSIKGGVTCPNSMGSTITVAFAFLCPPLRRQRPLPYKILGHRILKRNLLEHHHSKVLPIKARQDEILDIMCMTTVCCEVGGGSNEEGRRVGLAGRRLRGSSTWWRRNKERVVTKKWDRDRWPRGSNWATIDRWAPHVEGIFGEIYGWIGLKKINAAILSYAKATPPLHLDT